MIHSLLVTRHSSLVSVVIPVYNGGENFRRCLDALKACQPLPDEIIVVDDGSTDDSARIAREHGAKILTTDRPRSGPAIARNLGARAASGEVLLLIDADVAVHADVIDRVKRNFENDPELAACFGSYDAEPAAPNFLSQYRNLFHHYVHQSTHADASTFWAGCGAIRRNLFLKLGGFSETYSRPSIEDIELGYRLKAAGCKLRLDKGLLCQHLKRWTWRSLLRSDILDRGVPWTELILRAGGFVNDLNLQTQNRISVLLVYLLLLSFAIGLLQPIGWLASGMLAIVLLLLNREVYRFFARQRGKLFALCAIPMHWLYYFYNGLSFSIGIARHALTIDRKADRRSRWALWSMVAVMLIGAALRFVNLGRDSFWYDELLQVNIASHDLPTILSKLIENAAMPLDYFITHVMLIFGRSEFWLRFPAAMWGLLTLPIVYQLGRQLFDRSVGVLAAALLAVIGVHTFYSQEMRPYALLTLLAALSFYFLLKGVRTRHSRYWLAYSATIALAVLTHYFMLFLIGAQGLIVLIGWLRDRFARRVPPIDAQPFKFASALIPTIVILALTPWFGSVLDAGRLFVESVVAPSAIPSDAYLGAVRGGASPIDWSFFHDKILTNLTGGEPILPYTFLILCVIGAGYGLRPARRSTFMMLMWLIIPAGLVILFLYHFGTFFAIRYILYTVPAALLLIAFGIVGTWRALYDRRRVLWSRPKLSRVMRFGAAIVSVLLAGHFVNASIAYLTGQHDNWRGVGQFLMENVRSGDLLVLPQQSDNVEFYAPSLPVSPTSSNVPADLPAPLPHQRLWLLLNWYINPPGMYQAWLNGRPHLEYRFDDVLQVELITTAQTKAELLRDTADVRLPEIPILWAALAAQNEIAGNIDTALDQVQHALTLTTNRDQTLTLMLQRADILRRARRFDAALEAYRQVLKLDAGHVDGLVGLGRVLLLQNQIEAARAEFMQALALDPNSYGANLFLGQIDLRAGDGTRAADYFAVAARTNAELVSPP